MSENKHVTAVYVGRRMDTKNKLSYFWLFHGEEDAAGYKAQLVPAQIGEAWRFTRTPEGSILLSVQHKPTLLETYVSRGPQPVDQWIAKDAAHVQFAAHHRMLAKLAKRKGQFEIALQPIKRLLDALPYNDERGALIQKVVTELWKRS